jgi:transcriptional regulator with XRE-family HTH domain
MPLRLWLFNKNITYKQFGEMIKYDPGYISKICRGKMSAGRKFALIVEEATNYEVSADDILNCKKESSND